MLKLKSLQDCKFDALISFLPPVDPWLRYVFGIWDGIL